MKGMSFLTVIKAKDVGSLKGSGIAGLSPSPMSVMGIITAMVKRKLPGFIAQLKNGLNFKENYSG